jgi:hypothetical protein
VPHSSAWHVHAGLGQHRGGGARVGGSPPCEAQASASSSSVSCSASAAPLATSGSACSTLTAERGKIGPVDVAQRGVHVPAGVDDGHRAAVGRFDDAAAHDDASADQGLYLYAISTQDFMGGSIDLRQGFSYSFQPGDVVGQTFNIHNFNNNGFEWARGMLDVQTLTVSSVPEPASALLLAAGLLAFGARRGRHLLS